LLTIETVLCCVSAGAQLLKLPPAIRCMTLREFALTHSLSVASVTLQPALLQQQVMQRWVQQTPRMRGRRAGGEVAGLRDAASGALGDYMPLLMTAQRMTRATARKAGLIGGAQADSEQRYAVLVDPTIAAKPAVFQTPSTRAR
jgi:hypothetical protein